MLWGVRRERAILGTGHQPMERPMSKPNDLSRSLIAFEQNNTLIAVIEMRSYVAAATGSLYWRCS